MVDEFNPKHGQVVAIPFYKTNITTGAANEDLLNQSAVNTLQTMPKAGSVIGISCRTAAITAGTITARVQSGGTEIATTGYPAPVLSSTATGSYALARPRAIRFAAGDALGVSVSSTTTLDPTNTLDVDALLFVAFDLD